VKPGNRRLIVSAGVAVALLVLSASFASSGRTAAAPPFSAAQARAFALSQVMGGGRTASKATEARATSNTTPAPCKPGSQVLCSEVDVPLDYTGVVPGTIPLHVEEVPAQGTPRGAMFLIAGGPGQGSAQAFDLSSSRELATFQAVFPGYTLVAYDDRGTGNSGLLNCPGLQSAVTTVTEEAQLPVCAAALGTNRQFYSTIDHANDLEQVRVALGLGQIGLFGTSYGTKLAIAYALQYPQNVSRILLNSVLPTSLPDPYESNVLRAMPATLNAFCGSSLCKAATSNYGGEVVAEANALGAKPVQGKVLQPNGGFKTLTLSGLDFLGMILDSDLNPGLAAELPAVVHAARLGNPLPMLRTYELDSATSAESAIDLSSALYAATVCRDGAFPWPPDSAPADRPSLLQQAVAALPAGTLGAFGTWASNFGNASFCVNWPSPSGGIVYGAGPLPNVPMLALTGGYDMRTPSAGAVEVAAQFPQGHVVVVPGVGHDAFDSDLSGCAQLAVRNWMIGATVPASCPRPGALVKIAPAFPAAPTRAQTPLQTLAIATKTIQEAQAGWLMTAGLSGGDAVVPGITSGRVIESAQSFKFVNYGLAAGVYLNGTLKLLKPGTPLVFAGSVTVGGRFAATGLLGVSGSSVRGTLGGRLVGH
jgi:pimeloyl-ACP methyl ester carboxylesterase